MIISAGYLRLDTFVCLSSRPARYYRELNSWLFQLWLSDWIKGSCFWFESICVRLWIHYLCLSLRMTLDQDNETFLCFKLIISIKLQTFYCQTLFTFFYSLSVTRVPVGLFFETIYPYAWASLVFLRSGRQTYQQQADERPDGQKEIFCQTNELILDRHVRSRAPLSLLACL